MIRKKKLLIVHTTLAIGGSQLLLYMMIKGLSKYYDVTLLSRKGEEDRYYYDKISRLGVDILCCLDFANPPGEPPAKTGSSQLRAKARTFAKTIKVLLQKDRNQLPVCSRRNFNHTMVPTRWKEVDPDSIENWQSFFDRWDKIAIVQIENLYYLEEILPQGLWINLFVGSSCAQYTHDIYAGFRKNLPINFFTGPGLARELDGLRLSEYRVNTWNAPFSFSREALIQKDHKTDGIVHIAIFTRLSPEKPIADLLNVFKRIKRARPVVLHLFGEGDISQYDQATQALLNQEGILFEGQSDSLIDSCLEKPIDLVLAPCFGVTGGYADIELRGAGIPVLFWNYGAISDQELFRISNGAILAFHEIDVFAGRILQLLNTSGALKALSKLQIDDTRRRHDFLSNIRRIVKRMK